MLNHRSALSCLAFAVVSILWTSSTSSQELIVLLKGLICDEASQVDEWLFQREKGQPGTVEGCGAIGAPLQAFVEEYAPHNSSTHSGTIVKFTTPYGIFYGVQGWAPKPIPASVGI